MINVFKKGGDWKTLSGFAYTAKAINDSDRAKYLKDDWACSVEGVMSDEEKAKELKAVEKATKAAEK